MTITLTASVIQSAKLQVQAEVQGSNRQKLVCVLRVTYNCNPSQDQNLGEIRIRDSSDKAVIRYCYILE